MATEASKNRILITGASGFIGRHLAVGLSGGDRQLRVLLRKPEQAAIFADAATLEVALGTLQDADALARACRGVGTVVHPAGIAHVNNVPESELQAVNVQGTGRLLAAAIDQGVERLVYLSSSVVEGMGGGSSPASAYARSKQQAEALVLEAHSRGRIACTILRPANVYGVGMQGNIAAMVSLIARRRLPPLPRLETRVSMVAVGDLVEAVRLILANPSEEARTYPVSDGEPYTVAALEAAIYEALGRKKAAWRVPRMVLYGAAAAAELAKKIGGRRGGIGTRTYRSLTTDNLVSNAAICTELGFKPTTTFYRELPKIIAAMRL